MRVIADFGHSLMAMAERGDFAIVAYGYAVPRAIPPIFNIQSSMFNAAPAFLHESAKLCSLVRSPVDQVIDLVGIILEVV